MMLDAEGSFNAGRPTGLPPALGFGNVMPWWYDIGVFVVVTGYGWWSLGRPSKGDHRGHFH